MTKRQEKLLAEISETLIPQIVIPGAKDVYTKIFTLMMVNDSYEKEMQDRFVTGLKDIDKLSQKKD